MQRLDNIFNRAMKENPNIIIINGDFNAHSPFIWENETTQSAEGKAVADFCIKNSLEQIIDEATHMPNDHTQTCIDLIMTNQPFLFVDKGVIPFPDPLLKHQIMNGKLNFSAPHFLIIAHILAIRNQMNNIPWE